MHRKQRAAATAQQAVQATQAVQPAQVPVQRPRKRYSPLRYLLVPPAVSLILMGATGIASTAFIAADLLCLNIVILALTDRWAFWSKLPEHVFAWPILFIIILFIGGLYIVGCIDVMKWSACLIRHAVNPGRYVITFKRRGEQEQRKKKKRHPKSLLRRVKKVLATVGSYVGLGVFSALIVAFVLYLSWYFGWRSVLSGEFFDAVSLLRIVPPSELLDVWWDALETVIYAAGTVWAPIIVLVFSIKGRFPVIDKSANRECSE